MAKKHFGRFLTLAAIAGAAAAGISYFLQYKSFHKELDEDFHDFEDDFDDFDDTADKDGAAARNYVPLNAEKKDCPAKEGGTTAAGAADGAGEAAENAADAADEPTAEGTADAADEADAEETSEPKAVSGQEAGEPAPSQDTPAAVTSDPETEESGTTITVEEITE